MLLQPEGREKGVPVQGPQSHCPFNVTRYLHWSPWTPERITNRERVEYVSRPQVYIPRVGVPFYTGPGGREGRYRDERSPGE